MSVANLGLLPSSGYPEYSTTWCSDALAINSAGEVVGASGNMWSQCRPFLHNGTIHDLGLPPNMTSGYATAINDAGQIVVVAQGQTPGAHGTRTFIFDGSSYRSIGVFPGVAADPNYPSMIAGAAINAAGVVVGSAEVTPGVVHAFMYNGTLHDLGTLGGTWSCARGINSAGQIVGYSASSQGFMRAFLHSGAMNDLGTLGGGGAIAHGVNDAGNVVGYSWDNQNRQRAFLHNGSMHDLGTLPGGGSCWAYGISDSGLIVGEGWTPQGSFRAVVHDGAWRDLSGFIDVGDDFEVLRIARAINSAGQIVGAGKVPMEPLPRFSQRAFRTLYVGPVPPPRFGLPRPRRRKSPPDLPVHFPWQQVLGLPSLDSGYPQIAEPAIREASSKKLAPKPPRAVTKKKPAPIPPRVVTKQKLAQSRKAVRKPTRNKKRR